MAKIEGTQSIPAEWLDSYRAALAEKMPSGACRKRSPYRLPQSQAGGTDESDAQKEQRTRFLAIQEKFKNVDQATKQHWYEAEANRGSLLWYYNYFMMSGLIGNAVVGDKGGGVIKSINHYAFTYPSGTPSDVTIGITAVEPSKAIAFFYGAGWYEPIAGALVAISPFLVSLASTYAIVKMSDRIDAAAGGSISVIEYI